MKLEKLEKELNDAHKEYLKVSDIKSKEYKEIRNEYLRLSEEYRKELHKHLNKEIKQQND